MKIPIVGLNVLNKNAFKANTNIRLLSVVNHNHIGRPHHVSNLRLIKFAKPDDESQLENKFRNQLIEVQNWNHNYWVENNNNFNKQKCEFIENELKSKSEDSFKSNLSYDELSLFYKRFLDANHEKNINYNLEWYKRHTKLLWPAFLIFLHRLKKRLL